MSSTMKRCSAAAALTMSMAACNDDRSSTPTAPTVPATVPTRLIVESQRIKLQDPDWMAFDDQFLYVHLDNSDVVRLDPATGEQLGVTSVGGAPCQGVGAAFGSVWTCRGDDDELDRIVRIDPITDTVIASIDVEKARSQGNIAGGFDRVWVLSDGGASLVAIDPATNEPDEQIELGVIGADLAIGPDAVWVISSRDSAVLRIDPVTRSVTGRVDGITDATTIEAPDDVWVGQLNSVTRIDPATLAVIGSVDVGTGPTAGLTVDGTDLWIRNSDPLLVHVDASTGAVIERFDDPITSGGDVVVAFGAVWATAYNDALLVRLPKPEAT